MEHERFLISGSRSFLRQALRIAMASALLALLLGAMPASAAGVVGNGTPASCTEAALDAALAGGGLVTFNCGPNPVTIVVSEKTITRETMIDGDGLITLSGGDTNRILVVAPGTEVELIELTLTGGNGGRGGAISNGGILSIRRSHIINNVGQSEAAIFNGSLAKLFIGRSTIAGNVATFGFCGALNGAGETNIVHSVIRDNHAASQGGAICATGRFTIRDTHIVGNTAGFEGGGIYHFGGTLTIQQSTISENTAGTEGGGIFNLDDRLNLLNSTVTGNTAGTQGGGIFIQAGMVVQVGSTVAGNAPDDIAP
jgi:predicted outer membrane repeat protein